MATGPVVVVLDGRPFLSQHAIEAQVRCPRCYSAVEPRYNYCPYCALMFWPPAAVWPRSYAPLRAA